MELNGSPHVAPKKHALRQIVAVVCGLIVLGYLFFPPEAPLQKATLVGYSIPDRSFHMNGIQLPLCARCTGTYLGVAIGFLAVALLRRWYAGELLPKGMIVIAVAFIGIMGFDGVNSYLSLFPGMPHLYTPHNWLRAATGSLNGIALTMIVLPVFNYTLWKTTQPIPPLKNVWELLGIVAVTAGVVFVVQSEPAWLLYPVAMISTLGVLWMLTIVNTMILLIVFRQEGRAETWRDAVPALLGGLTVALIELTAMGVLRYALTGTMGWPLALGSR
jgi:uncharacterized membrane protein